MAQEDKANEFEGQGGSYIRHPGGRLERAEEPTKDHPDGNCARDADGNALDPAIRAREEAAAVEKAKAGQTPAAPEGGE